MNKLVRAFNEPRLVFRKGLFLISEFIASDKVYLSMLYYLTFGKKLNWDSPTTFQEKLQLLKLWSKDKGYSRYVDKYSVRQYVEEKLGTGSLIPLLGVWDSFDEIDFDKLPDQFVLKTTHDSGGIAICKDKSSFDFQLAKKCLTNRLKRNYYWRGREYPYKNVKPRIIAEKFMVDESGWDLKDYKFFCFNGEPMFLFIASERFRKAGGTALFDYYDMNLNHMRFSTKGHAYTTSKGKKIVPNFDEMKRMASVLSEGFPHVRIDFYNVNGEIYFGEMTFFHDGGLVTFEPIEWNIKLGNLIIIPQ